MNQVSDTLGRRKRTRASSTGKRLRLTLRDQAWLTALHRHGPLSSSFLLAFAAPLAMNEKRARERLGDLFHEANTPHGGSYLARPAQQFQTLGSHYNPLVYDLTPSAQTALRAIGAWSERSVQSAGPWWHRFMVSAITASVELAAAQRPDIGYIPQAAILDRAGAGLEWPVEYVDPASSKRVTKVLKPDAIFGLEYRSLAARRFRFFIVEADRASEPLTTRHWSRKSAARSFAQYQQYVGAGLYKRHLGLTAPILVLNVTTSLARQAALIKTLMAASPSGNDYTLFQTWDAFCVPPQIPAPNQHLLDGLWQRAGRSALRIDG